MFGYIRLCLIETAGWFGYDSFCLNRFFGLGIVRLKLVVTSCQILGVPLSNTIVHSVYSKSECSVPLHYALFI